VSKRKEATQTDLADALEALTRPSTPQGRALRDLAAALQELSDSLQPDSARVQIRAHVFCDPRGRPAGPGLDITCQALTEQQLERATAAGEWQERERFHNWSPGQDPWDLERRTPARYRSRVTRLPAGGIDVLLRLDADAAFHAKPGPDGQQQPGSDVANSDQA
jgi:hypothetical protein